MRGIEKQGQGVNITLEGTFGYIGQVYYSDNASANILSFASQVDNGCRISYNQDTDDFTMESPSRQNVYTFKRKPTSTGEGRMYACDTRTMVQRSETVLIQTGR
jgi:hypothetical protein